MKFDEVSIEDLDSVSELGTAPSQSKLLSWNPIEVEKTCLDLSKHLNKCRAWPRQGAGTPISAESTPH